MPQRVVEQNGDFARGGGDRLGLPYARGQPSIERAQRSIGPPYRACRETQQGGSPIAGASRSRRQHPAAGDLVMRCERQPGREVLRCRPGGEGGPAFSNQLQRQRRPQASELTRTGPLSLMKADPSDARLLGMSAAAQRAAAGRGDGLLWPVSLFGERAVSSPRPTFQTATRAASVKRGAEQPGATRSAL
jgi:hypothetical protein